MRTIRAQRLPTPTLQASTGRNPIKPILLALLAAISALETVSATAAECSDATTGTLTSPERTGSHGGTDATTPILIEGVIVQMPPRGSNRRARKHDKREVLAPLDRRHADAVITSANVLWATNFVSADVTGCKLGGLCYVATLGDDLDSLMAVLANHSQVQVLSRPRVMTSNGVPANIFIGSTVPYVPGIYSGSGRGRSRSLPQFGTGWALRLTPATSPDGLMVIDLHQRIDQLETVKLSGVDVPAVNSAELQAKVLVQNRQTFVLGGWYATPKNRVASRETFSQPIDLRGATLLVSSAHKTRRELIALFRPIAFPALESRTESRIHQP